MSKSMSKRKKNSNELIRSSAAEYLTFIAASGDSESSVEMHYEDVLATTQINLPCKMNMASIFRKDTNLLIASYSKQ